MRRLALTILVAAITMSAAGEEPPATVTDTQVVLAYIESNQPRIRGGGGIIGRLQYVRRAMDAQARQSSAILTTTIQGRLEPPATPNEPWVLRVDVLHDDLQLGAGLSSEAAEQARIDAETVLHRLRAWRRELDESEAHCLLTNGALSCTVASPFEDLGVLRGGPGIVDAHYATVDISGDWEIVGEPGAVLTIVQNVGRISATWKSLPRQAAAFAPPDPGSELDLPVTPPTFNPNPPSDRRSVGGAALRGVLAIRNLDAQLWLAQSEQTANVNLDLTPQGDLLEGVAWIPQEVSPDREGLPFASQSFALRRVRSDQPEVEVRFVARTERGYYYDIDALPYAEPFWVEVVYRAAPARRPGTVQLTWADNENLTLPVLPVDGEPTVFRSHQLFAEQMVTPDASEEGDR